jgi:hypothetical protein
MHADNWIPGILHGYCHPAVLEHAILPSEAHEDTSEGKRAELN